MYLWSVNILKNTILEVYIVFYISWTFFSWTLDRPEVYHPKIAIRQVNLSDKYFILFYSYERWIRHYRVDKLCKQQMSEKC